MDPRAETVAASPSSFLRLANLDSEIADRLSVKEKIALMWIGRPGAELRNEANVRRETWQGVEGESPVKEYPRGQNIEEQKMVLARFDCSAHHGIRDLTKLWIGNGGFQAMVVPIVSRKSLPKPSDHLILACCAALVISSAASGPDRCRIRGALTYCGDSLKGVVYF